MIPKDCKRLAEADFPIADVSRHAVREKSIRHGNPSTLHLWWARRPLASSRAVLLALLLPDPCDPSCPSDFKTKARELLPLVQGKVGSTDSDLRRALLKFVGDIANWDVVQNAAYLDVGRALVKAAHGDERPLVVDPFAGGGAIPIEALRLGCDSFASDLNPVSCMILRIMLEDIPRRRSELSDTLRSAGAEIKRKAETKLGHLYPSDPQKEALVAYLWARTVRCESPNCGAIFPLARSFWLSKNQRRRKALRYKITSRQDHAGEVVFEIFEPKTDSEVPPGTVTRAKATCVVCKRVLPPDRVRAQLAAQRGGADVQFDSSGERVGGALMLAVVTLRPGQTGRFYRLPTKRDYEAVRESQELVSEILAEWEASSGTGMRPFPDEPTPTGGGSGAGRAFSVHKYGMSQWADLFTARQKLSLATIASLIAKEPSETAEALAASLSRLADKNASLAVWNQVGEKIEHVFGRQALPIVWDFAEVPIFSDSTGNFSSGLDLVREVVESSPNSVIGQVQLADAADHPLPDESAGVWFTDPPYYDAVPYADLSDFFLVWLKRALPGHALLKDPFDLTNPLSPKRREIVQDETKYDNGAAKDGRWFEAKMAVAFAEGHRVLRNDGVASVVFAHKTTEGWEALLSAIVRAQWTITGSWPIATERPGRLRSQDSAALATSVHLICRPRRDDAAIGDWGEVLRELPNRVGDWMERLQGEGVRGADLVFACIGPALEVFSRYAKVETADGREVPLSEYLEKVWEVVGRSALEHILGTAEARARNGAAGALEEDARLTALFLWTVQATNGDLAASEGGSEDDDGTIEEDEIASPTVRKGLTLVFDVVRRFAQPLGINLAKWEGRVIETKKGLVRLLPVSERATQIFGADGAQEVAARIEREYASGANTLQGVLFPEMEDVPRISARRTKALLHKGEMNEVPVTASDATTLDRIHAAMLLQAGGRTNALRALIKAEQDQGSDFIRLANALTALYPKGSEEKRLLDAMLLAAPR